MALTDTFVKQVKWTGRAAGDKHSDGGGMYLLVKAAGRYWRMDYRHLGKQKTLALGVYPAVSLAKARKRRDEARELLADGQDPSAAKQDAQQAKLKEAANTFEVVAREWLEQTAANRAAVTQGKVRTWLEKDVFPHIGHMPMRTIGPRDVLEKVVRRMEARGVIDTAHRIKQLCGQVFRYAVVTGSAERDVTADLKDALKAKVKEHHAALTDPKDVGKLLRAIHDYTGHPTTVAALKLAPMVFVRPGELRTAEWAEIDLDGAEWRIPGSKMKMKNDHIVPLCKQAVEVLRSIQPLTGHCRYVFPSIRTGQRPMSENTINGALRGMGYTNTMHTGHGFRATARTIMDEVLEMRVDLIEHQLAHTVKDANGRAYNRTAHLPARRKMMQKWADYLDKLRTGADVIPMHKAA
jgi:integrase